MSFLYLLLLSSPSAAPPLPRCPQSWRVLWLDALFGSCCIQTSMEGRHCCAPSAPHVTEALRRPPCGNKRSLLITSFRAGFSTVQCSSYLEMLLQQAMVMEQSGGQILSKCRRVRSVRRTQPLTSSSRRYWDPLVRYCTAISVIWGRAEEDRKHLAWN